MTPKEIADAAIAQLNKRITDEVFLIIQKDPKLMHEYLRAVEANGLDTVNQTVGRSVKERYNLTNADTRQKRPASTLIQSHQEFAAKQTA